MLIDHFHEKRGRTTFMLANTARTATANKFIKLAFALMRNETLYYPRTGNPLMTEKEYYQGVWDRMKPKLAPYLCDDIPQDNYLTKIQHELEEKYGINT